MECQTFRHAWGRLFDVGQQRHVTTEFRRSRPFWPNWADLHFLARDEFQNRCLEPRQNFRSNRGADAGEKFRSHMRQGRSLETSIGTPAAFVLAALGLIRPALLISTAPRGGRLPDQRIVHAPASQDLLLQGPASAALLSRRNVRIWHFTSFGCTAEIGRDRANADLAPSSAANDL